MKRTCLPTLLILVCATSMTLAAEQSAESTGRGSDSAKESTLTLAVLGFSADDPTQPELGEKLSDAIIALLADEPGISIVDRGSLQRTLTELELNLTGLTDPSQVIRVGRLVGARLLVTGRAFRLGEQVVFTAKLISTETTRSTSAMVTGKPDSDTAEMVFKLAKRIAERVRADGARLVGDGDPQKPDPLRSLREQLAGRELPVTVMIVTEEHHDAAPRHPEVPDPAVETEIKKMLLACGVEVRDLDANKLTRWIHGHEAGVSWPRDLDGVDWVISGEAFSESAARLSNLRSCTARAEINVIERTDGRIVMADRVQTRAVDLSEQLAAKAALQKAGRQLGLEVLRLMHEATAEQVDEAEPNPGQDGDGA